METVSIRIVEEIMSKINCEEVYQRPEKTADNNEPLHHIYFLLGSSLIGKNIEVSNPI